MLLQGRASAHLPPLTWIRSDRHPQATSLAQNHVFFLAKCPPFPAPKSTVEFGELVTIHHNPYANSRLSCLVLACAKMIVRYRRVLCLHIRTQENVEKHRFKYNPFPTTNTIFVSSSVLVTELSKFQFFKKKCIKATSCNSFLKQDHMKWRKGQIWDTKDI